MPQNKINELELEIINLKERLRQLENDGANYKNELSNLIENKKLFSQFMNNLPGYAYVKDSDRRIIFVNDKLAQDFNIPAEEWIGKRNEDIWPGPFGEGIKAADEKLLNEMKLVVYEEKFNSEGTTKTFFTTKFPVLLEDGSKYLGGVSVDISQSKLAEEELFVTKEKYRIILDESTDPIFSFERDGTYKYLNNAFAAPFKKKPEEIIGKKIWDIFPHDEAEKRFSVVKRVFETGEVVVFEVRVPLPTGDRFYITSVKPVMDKDGNVAMVICISKEITDRKKIEYELSAQNLELKSLTEKLQSANASKDKFISILAHDLRSPFFGMLGLSEVLTSDCDEMSHAEIKTQLENISRTMKNLYNLVDELLTWSTIETGKLVINPTQINLRQEIDEAIAQYEVAAAHKKITMTNWITDEILVNADKQMIRLLTRNLISNAIKFTNHSGRIDIRGMKNNDIAEIVVEDTGIGMPSDLVNKLFDLSSNVTKQGTDGEVGTGLGLLLCKEILDKHKGSIWVESQEKVGSKFHFKLPIDN